jgi:hypothetical protein
MSTSCILKDYLSATLGESSQNHERIYFLPEAMRTLLRPSPTIPTKLGHIRLFPFARLLPRAPSFFRSLSPSSWEAFAFAFAFALLPSDHPSNRSTGRVRRHATPSKQPGRGISHHQRVALPNRFANDDDDDDGVAVAVNAVQGEGKRRHGRDRTQRPDRTDQEGARHATREKAAGGEPKQAVPSRIYCMVQNEDGWSPVALIGYDDDRKEGTPPAASRSRRSRSERWIFLAFVPERRRPRPTNLLHIARRRVHGRATRLLCVHTTISRNKRVAACGSLP